MRTPLPEDEYIRKLGKVVFLVAFLEGALMYDLPRLQRHGVLPPELNFMTPTGMKMTGMTTRKIGEYLVAHAPKCTDPDVARYLEAGGRALIEVAPLRNDVLHSRPGIDGTDPKEPMRLIRMLGQGPIEVITDEWLDQLIERINEIQYDLNILRHIAGP